MSETQLQLFIHDCPDDQADALVDSLNEFELNVDWNDQRWMERGELFIGSPYTDDCAYGDKSKDVAAAIIESAPGATFTVWTDANYEFLGALVRYTPTLGRRDDDCDGQGQAVFTEDEVTRWAASAKPVSALAGIAWTEALTGSTNERVIKYVPSEE